MMNKNTLRKQIQTKRKELSESYKQDASSKIVDLIVHSSWYQQAQTIFVFVSMDGEVDTHSLIEKAWQDGKVVVVPKVESRGIMHAYSISNWDDLEPGAYGILEPKAEIEKIMPEAIDLAIIPCCTCNEQGQRLGFGGGFYDRYLENQTFIKMIVCFHNLMEESIPVDEHDQIMDVVVSEIGINNKKQ